MPNSSKSDKTEAASSFWSELKRRKVMRVGITYAVVAWLLIQVSATVFPQLGMPDWAPRMVTLLLLIEFPIAVIIAVAFEQISRQEPTASNPQCPPTAFVKRGGI